MSLPPACGLRVDVCTREGLRLGVPRLLEILGSAEVTATFYLAMGPDRSGRAVLNLLRPGFVAKMRRTGAARLYGWRTLLAGTLLPARPVATGLPEIARAVAAAGHEVGVHGWDHRRWQDRITALSDPQVAGEMDRAQQAFRSLFDAPPRTAAAPAWRTSAGALLHQEHHRLAFASDCRGDQPFLPLVGETALATPQVPTTLPTLDEALGDQVPDAEGFFRLVLERVQGAPWPVLTVHAEHEGRSAAGPFGAFLAVCHETDLAVLPLGELLRRRRDNGPLPLLPLGEGTVRGRHGLVSTPLRPRPTSSSPDAGR